MMNDAIDFHIVQAGNKQDETLLLLHGFLGNSADWKEITETLAPDYQTVAIDLPGHGRTKISDQNFDYSIEKTADAIARLIESNFDKKINLIGYSMGGRLAFYLIINFPHLFEKAIIESASPGIKEKQDRQARLKNDIALAEKIKNSPLEEFLKFWYGQPLFESLALNPEKLKSLISSRMKNDRLALAKSLSMMSTGRQPSLWKEIGKISLPICLIVGRKDFKFQEINKDIAARIKNCELHLIQDCGHNVHAENPIGFCSVVKTFLNK